MKDQVLSKEQMLELINMGVDVSKASMCWNYNDEQDRWALVVNFTHSPYIEGYIIPTFTLQNMLDMLPNSIDWEGKTYWFTVFINGLNHKMIGYRDPELWALEFDINGAFEYIKWCKENKFI